MARSKKAKVSRIRVVKSNEPRATSVRAVNTATPAFAVRKLIVEHPTATVGQIEELLTAAGQKIDGNTVRGLFQGGMGLLKVADHLGFALTKK